MTISLHGDMILVQVISGDLNRVVVELLQQLLFWQERQKAQDPLKAAKKKRLVSGLRSKLNALILPALQPHSCRCLDCIMALCCYLH